MTNTVALEERIFADRTELLLAQGCSLRNAELRLFGESLREARQARGMTAVDCAAIAGVRRNQYLKWENGKAEIGVLAAIRLMRAGLWISFLMNAALACSKAQGRSES